MSEQLSIREQARRAYEEAANSVKARMLTQRNQNQEEEVTWLKETFSRTLEDFASEGIKARVHRRYTDDITGLQIKGNDLFTSKETWSVSCTTWAELGEQLDPDTFEAYTSECNKPNPSNLPTWDNEAY